MSQEEGVNRRDVLKKTAGAGATAGIASVAGCSNAGDPVTPGDPDQYTGRRPIVFVHGLAGSATQFESQAMRFSSNGYPDDYLNVFEYNSLAYGGGSFTGGLAGLFGSGDIDPETVYGNLDAKIDEVLAATGAEKVDAIGHSLGTRVMTSYMNSDAAREAKVAQYVNLDGFVPDATPGVPTLAVWGMGNLVGGEDTSYPGAETASFEGQTHVEVATSDETFAAIYDFFTGSAPDTTDIVVEPAGDVTVSGRGQLFPSNDVPDADVSLEIYEIDPATGQRVGGPVAAPTVADDGTWGPVDIDATAPHEYALSIASTDQTHHHYRQPELRSNRFVRLLTSLPGEGIDLLIEKSEGHAAMITLRDKEWWGDQGAANDELAIDGTNVINATTAAQGDNVIAPFVFDEGSDGQTDLSSQAGIFGPVPFMSGVDHYVPAASPPDGTIEATSTPRGGDGLQRTFRLPNYASSGHRISLYFPDHTQSR